MIAKGMQRTALLVGTLMCLSITIPETMAAVTCNVTSQCESLLRIGSQCVDGFCSNPYGSGCLYNRKPNWNRKRVCNSDDPPDSGARGICRPPEDGFNYMEIRIASQNWESVFFEAWVMQIILSEILDVPTTLETGSPDIVVNLYDPTNRFEYGASNLFDAIREAAIQGDCRKVDRSANIPCAHLIPEVWAGWEKTIASYTASGYIEPPSFIGVVGQEGLYMPNFTASRDPSLVSYHGLAGEQNRRKLADRFLRPTTWSDYCVDVSTNKCQKPDGVATRAPLDETERGSYFVDGHIGDYPCGWHSYVVPQTYWLDIALKSDGKELSGGYTYNQLSQIWNAANATKSDIITMWWNPEAVYQTFLKTDTQMEYVSMPPPDPQCIAAHIDPAVRCNGTYLQKIGESAGVCSDPPLSLLKVIATSLKSNANDPSIVTPLRSPGYEAVKSFRMNNVQLTEIFDYWLHSNFDKYSFGPREATCRWVVENFDTILGLVPSTYPRVLTEDNEIHGTLAYVALIIAIVATFSVLASSVITYFQRERKVMKYAQLEFMFLLLVGVLMVSVASLVQVLQPTNQRCVAVIWLVNLGFSLEVVPLIVKVAAINRLMQAAQKMRRVQLTRKTLFGAVTVLCGVIAIFLIFWTLLDPPRKTADYKLTEETTSDDQTIILTTFFCQSSSEAWAYISVLAEFFMLVCTSVVAFQTRKLRQDLNETQTLAVLTYSHFMFMSMRVTILVLQGSINVTTASYVFSLIYSLDSVATIVIYFVPKFLWNQLGDNEANREWMLKYLHIPIATGSREGNGSSDENEAPNAKYTSRDGLETIQEFSERGGPLSSSIIRTGTDTSISHAGMRMDSDISQVHWQTEVDSDLDIHKSNLDAILEDQPQEKSFSNGFLEQAKPESAPYGSVSAGGSQIFETQQTRLGPLEMEEELGPNVVLEENPQKKPISNGFVEQANSAPYGSVYAGGSRVFENPQTRRGPLDAEQAPRPGEYRSSGPANLSRGKQPEQSPHDAVTQKGQQIQKQNSGHNEYVYPGEHNTTLAVKNAIQANQNQVVVASSIASSDQKLAHASQTDISEDHQYFFFL